MILCASELRVVWGGGVADLVSLAADSGFDGIAVGDRCTRADVASLIGAASSSGLAVPVGPGLIPDVAPGEGKRLPYLASIDDGDERRAALALFAATVEALVPLGVRTCTVELGEVPLRTTAAAVAFRFARVELGEDEPGEREWAAAVGERRARSGAILDASRSCLDRLLPVAERREVTVALDLAAGPWAMPSPREALALLAEYREAPLGVVWDHGRMQVLRALGLGPSAEPRAELRAAARVWREDDAVGMEAGYLPGLGDPDPDARANGAAAGRPASALVIVTGFLDSTPVEVARARALVAAGTAGAQSR